MKKVVFTIFMVAVAYTANSQENNGQTAKGKFLIDLSTQVGGSNYAFTNTGFGFTNVHGYNAWSLGLGGGYFIADNFALTAGFGYADGSHGGNSTFSYKIGAKYYLKGKIPFAVNLSGSNVDVLNDRPLFLGLSGGYAFFLGDKLSIEPKINYSIPLKNRNFLKKSLSLGVSFSIHL
ncbi:MAG: hypothetical protein JKY44_08740 [Flavobacteriaceae bacterium]|nr:hypothetical protein [Flavobacteriaceae bacterium]